MDRVEKTPGSPKMGGRSNARLIMTTVGPEQGSIRN